MKVELLSYLIPIGWTMARCVMLQAHYSDLKSGAIKPESMNPFLVQPVISALVLGLSVLAKWYFVSAILAVWVIVELVYAYLYHRWAAEQGRRSGDRP